jgi:hypothetical protein
VNVLVKACLALSWKLGELQLLHLQGSQRLDRILQCQMLFAVIVLARQILMLRRSQSSVSVAAAILERAGLIRYNGAELAIIDCEKLESVSCSCYWVVRRQQSAMG